MSRRNKHKQELKDSAGYPAKNESNEDYKGDEDTEDGKTLAQVEGGWIETYTGRRFSFDPIDAESIAIDDIAHALSNLCRYCGHTQRFYSVAEHSILMARYMQSHLMNADGDIRETLVGRDCLTALLHDASEAYVGDMTRPLKALFPGFREIEERIHEVVATKFGTYYPHPQWVKDLDMRILKDERAQAMYPSDNEWGTDALEALGVGLRFWEPAVAKIEFMASFNLYRKMMG